MFDRNQKAIQMVEIVLYASRASRSLAGYWMLEELCTPYTVVDVDLRQRKQLEPGFLKINLSGRVPVVSVDGMIVSERPAICALIVDRFGYGSLAPAIDPRIVARISNGWSMRRPSLIQQSRCGRRTLMRPLSIQPGILRNRQSTYLAKLWRGKRGCWETSSQRRMSPLGRSL